MSPRALQLAAALALVLAGCGGGEPARTLELDARVVGLEGLALDSSTYLRLVPPAGLAPWQAASPRVEVGPLPGLEPGALPDALLMWGQVEKRVSIPGPFDPARFDAVELALVLRSTARVRVRLLREGREVLGSREAELAPSDQPQTALFAFARNALEREPYDALEVVLPPGLGGPVCLLSVELRRRPFAAWVLDADDAPRLVEVGGEAREARGIGGPIRRAARFRAPAGAELELSCALAPELRLPGQEPALRVRLRAGEQRREAALPLERADEGEPRWHHARVPLAAFAGREVELELELDGGGREAYGWVGGLLAVVPQGAPPTVLLVTSDTHRADHVGAARAGVAVDTPALDALAARGVLYERSHSSTNITLPSHAALLTGLSPRDTRVVDNLTPLAEEARTLAERFRAAGWRTFAAVSASHLAPTRSGLGQGFERFSAPERSLRDVAETLSALRRWLPEVEGQPLFVWLHLFDAHTPYAPPEQLAERYLAGSLALPTDGAELADLDDALRLERARYKGEVTKLDRALGTLLAEPRFQAGVVALTADHGECLGQHEIYYDHAELYPDTVRVPLILAWPGAPAGARCSLPVEHLGLGRTLLELAGLPAGDFPGDSLTSALRAGASARPLFALAYGGESAAITLGDLHLILHLADHEIDKGGRVLERSKHALELYDLAADPACERELSAERPDDARRLRRALVEWFSQAAPEGLAAAPSADPAWLAELAALGYAGQRAGGDGPWIDPACACERCALWR